MSKSGKVLRTESQELLVRLSPDEVLARGSRLAQLEGELQDFHVRKKSTTKALAEEEQRLEGDIYAIARVVRNKAEARPVDVEIVQAGRNSVKEIRTDTGEVLIERSMREDERQDDLFVVPKGDA